MNKPFPHYRQRSIESLEGLWGFEFHEGVSMDSLDPASLSPSGQMPVPAAFDAQGAHLGKRGTAVYSRTLRITPNTPALLEFEAVNFACKVLLDGQVIGTSFCGYTPFTLRVPPSNKPERALMVLVENRFDKERVPMHEPYFDFYQYGGIIRGVWLHQLPDLWIEQVKVDATDYRGGRITVHGKLSGSGSLEVSLPGAGQSPLKIEAGEDGSFSGSLTIDNPEPWSPQSPHLYTLKVSTANDDTLVRFGLREIKAEGNKVLLNDQAIRLAGYNRHEFFPNFGPSTPFSQQVEDIRLMKELGCNFLRGAHYPQDQRLLDLCDEFGLLVWEEVLGWQQKAYALENPLYRQHHSEAARQMVERSYNHPSVILWGLLNEGVSDHESFGPVLAETIDIFRSSGGNRLISYASDRPLRDLYFDQVDVISINCYPGWFECEDHPDPLSLIEPHYEKCIQHMEESGFADKPLFISETGCEAIYAFRNEMRDFHSEEYQVDYLERACQCIFSHERILGVAIWQFFDSRTYFGGRALGRPRAYNNAGTSDEYRRPKLAREVVRKAFGSRCSVVSSR